MKTFNKEEKEFLTNSKSLIIPIRIHQLKQQARNKKQRQQKD